MTVDLNNIKDPRPDPGHACFFPDRTDRLIRHRGAITVRQAVETISGVTSINAIPGSQSFRIRGLNDGFSNLRHGFRESSNQRDVQGIKRFEVLEGPASVLYGVT